MSSNQVRCGQHNLLLCPMCPSEIPTVPAKPAVELKPAEPANHPAQQSVRQQPVSTVAVTAVASQTMPAVGRDKATQVPDPYPLFPAELKALERFGLYRIVWNDAKKKNDKPPYMHEHTERATR